jgi:hypothetical protein
LEKVDASKTLSSIDSPTNQRNSMSNSSRLSRLCVEVDRNGLVVASEATLATGTAECGGGLERAIA